MVGTGGMLWEVVAVPEVHVEVPDVNVQDMHFARQMPDCEPGIW